MTITRRLLALGTVLVVFGGCDPDGVTIAYTPPTGETYEYRYEIESSTTRVLEGGDPVHGVRSSTITAEHRVVRSDGDGVHLEVVLERDDEEPRRYEVRFDRAAQLVGIDRVDGVALGLVGEVALSDLFTGGPPPKGELRPGDSWRVDSEVQLPAASRSVQLTGRGRLLELDVVDGLDVAVVESDLTVPVVGTTDDGQTAIEGEQRSTVTVTYALEDGSVVDASSDTTGELRLVVRPPQGVVGQPVTGWLEYDIETTTERTD